MNAGKSLTFAAERTGAYAKVEFHNGNKLLGKVQFGAPSTGPKHAEDDKNGFLLVARSSAGEVRGVLVKP